MILNKEDSIRLFNSLYNPTKEEIDKKIIAINKLKDIKIIKTDNGFSAGIEGLDLSFIRKEN